MEIELLLLSSKVRGKEEPLFRSAVISVFTRRRRHSQRNNGFVVHAEAAGEETETPVNSSSYSGV